MAPVQERRPQVVRRVRLRVACCVLECQLVELVVEANGQAVVLAGQSGFDGPVAQTHVESFGILCASDRQDEVAVKLHLAAFRVFLVKEADAHGLWVHFATKHVIYLGFLFTCTVASNVLAVQSAQCQAGEKS